MMQGIVNHENMIYPRILSDAIEARNERMISLLLKNDDLVDVNSADFLQTASMEGCVPVLRRILAEGNHGLEAVDEALRDCIEYSGNPEAVVLLVAKAATLGDPAEVLSTSLELVLDGDREAAALALIDELGVRPTMTHAYSAAHSGCGRVLAMALADDTELVGERLSKHLAWMLKSSYDPEVLRLLLDAGADIHTIYAVDECCRKLRLDSLQMLLDAGAKIMPQNPESLYWTLRMAHKHPERHDDLVPMVRLLLDLGAPTRSPHNIWSVLRRDAFWNTPIAEPFMDAVDLVLERDPGLLEWRDDRGRTRLLEAMEEHDSEMVRFLIVAGADVNARDAEGKSVVTMLPHAASNSIFGSRCRYFRLLVQELLEAGLDLERTDDKQQTALHSLHAFRPPHGEQQSDRVAAMLTTMFAEHVLAQPRAGEAALVRPREEAGEDEETGESSQKKQRVSV
jgi:hypothetical protein